MFNKNNNDAKKTLVNHCHIQTLLELDKFQKLCISSSSLCKWDKCIIKQMKMKHKCQSYDNPSEFRKLANTVVSEWLAELFNKCIN